MLRRDAVEGQEGKGHLAEGGLNFTVAWRNRLSRGDSTCKIREDVKTHSKKHSGSVSER